MDSLPELPFERILSFLSLEDVIKSRGVSRNWCIKTDSFRVKSLCYSEQPSDFIEGKGRWVSGSFAKNFISSTRFASFFNTFSQSILSNLKHLRLCDLRLDEENRPAFALVLNSFSQLEELDLIGFAYPRHFRLNAEVKLNLPMLNSIQLGDVCAMRKLTLDAPRLKQVKIWQCPPYLRLDIVHTEPIERLLVDLLEYTVVNNLKNLQYLNYLYMVEKSIDSTLLSSLEQLKEIHLDQHSSLNNLNNLFEQKQRYGRTELKIYLRGLLLSGPNDPAIGSLVGELPSESNVELLRCLAEHPSRLADEIPFEMKIDYSAIERAFPGSEINVLKRFTDLSIIFLNRPVQNVQHFLNFLKSFPNIVVLTIFSDQPQNLFDRLPEYSAVQRLNIFTDVNIRPSDYGFLFRLKQLIYLELSNSFNAETVRKIFKELQYLSLFSFVYNKHLATIKTGHSKRFEVFSFDRKWTNVADLNAAIQYYSGNVHHQPKRRRL